MSTRPRGERIRLAMNQLNALSVGELSSLETKLEVIHGDLAGLGVDDLSQVVQTARERLRGGNVAEFRRLVSQAVAKLGHLR